MVLVLVLLAQMLPAEVLAAEVAAVGDAGNESMVTDFAAAQPEVVAEVPKTGDGSLS